MALYENNRVHPSSDRQSSKIEVALPPVKGRRPSSELGSSAAAEKQAKKVFNIAKEIMLSEKEYVKVLCLINIDFREYIEKGRREAKAEIIPDKVFARIFSNLLELQMLNADLLKDFQARVQNWENVKMIADIIVQKGAFLKLYTSYVQDFQEISEIFITSCDKYPAFGKLVRDFEALEKCGKLKISHFMLKPVQRLPQYKLLLEEYSKNLSPSSQDFDNATKALDIVTKAAQHVNEKMKHNVSTTIDSDLPGKI